MQEYLEQWDAKLFFGCGNIRAIVLEQVYATKTFKIMLMIQLYYFDALIVVIPIDILDDVNVDVTFTTKFICLHEVETLKK